MNCSNNTTDRITFRQPTRSAVSKKAVLPLVLILLALAVRLVILDKHTVWGDEAFSLAMVTGHSVGHQASSADAKYDDFMEAVLPVPAAHFAQYYTYPSTPIDLGRVIRAVSRSDFSPPIYYVVLHYWTSLFGANYISLRMLSVSASLGVLSLLWYISRGLHSGTVGATMCCLLFALSPRSLGFSVEGRMYAVAWLMSLLVYRDWETGGCHIVTGKHRDWETGFQVTIS